MAPDIVDLFEHGQFYPSVDLCAGAKAVFDTMSASDIRDTAGFELKLNLISVRERMTQGIIRFFY